MPKSYIHVFMTTTDNGSDQIAVRNHLHSEFSRKPGFDFMMFFGLPCLKHQYHLVAKSHLQLCDIMARKMHRTWRYFSALATLCHVWRGHLAKIRSTWRNQHGHQPDFMKQKAAYRTPPLAVAGRWASVDGYFVRTTWLMFICRCSYCKCLRHVRLTMCFVIWHKVVCCRITHRRTLYIRTIFT